MRRTWNFDGLRKHAKAKGEVTSSRTSRKSTMPTRASQLIEDNHPAPVFFCAGGCGYPVAYEGTLCGECACEDDCALW